MIVSSLDVTSHTSTSTTCEEQDFTQSLQNNTIVTTSSHTSKTHNPQCPCSATNLHHQNLSCRNPRSSYYPVEPRYPPTLQARPSPSIPPLPTALPSSAHSYSTMPHSTPARLTSRCATSTPQASSSTLHGCQVHASRLLSSSTKRFSYATVWT